MASQIIQVVFDLIEILIKAFVSIPEPFIRAFRGIIQGVRAVLRVMKTLLFWVPGLGSFIGTVEGLFGAIENLFSKILEFIEFCRNNTAIPAYIIFLLNLGLLSFFFAPSILSAPLTIVLFLAIAPLFPLISFLYYKIRYGADDSVAINKAKEDTFNLIPNAIKYWYATLYLLFVMVFVTIINLPSIDETLNYLLPWVLVFIVKTALIAASCFPIWSFGEYLLIQDYSFDLSIKLTLDRTITYITFVIYVILGSIKMTIDQIIASIRYVIDRITKILTQP